MSAISGRSVLVKVEDLELLHQTDKAWLFQTPDGQKVWFPKSWGEWDEEEKTLETEHNKALEKELI